MNTFNIPSLIFSGNQERCLRRRVVWSLFLAILLHLIFFTVWEKTRGIPLLAQNLKQPHFSEQREKPLQMVAVDVDLVSEEQVPNEIVRLRGRINRASSAPEIDSAKPLLGPSGEHEEPIDVFKSGRLAPENTPVVLPPAAVLPQPSLGQAVTQPPMQEMPNPELSEKWEEKEEPKNSKKNPGKKTENLAAGNEPPALEALSSPAKAIEKFRLQAPGKKISAPSAESSSSIEIIKQNTPTPPVAKTAPRPESHVRKPVPTRRIGGASGAGGRLRKITGGSAAMKAGVQSMAVLRDRYGEYMDKVLRRIQNAIYIQQQISPLMFNQGAVVMTFTISSGGRLEKIKFVAARPADLVQETAAARQVLEDVQNGEPLPRPTAEMLRDPDFQKITINFIFTPE